MTSPRNRKTRPVGSADNGNQLPCTLASPLSLLALAFISGALVLLLEVLASRILAPYLGSSFSVWVNIIGTILAALSVGYLVGGILADRNQGLLPFIFLAAAIACAFIFFARPLLPLLEALGLTWGSLLAAILFFAPPSMILGTVSPYLVKLATASPKQLGRASGRIFAASTLGSLVGTWLGGFWLIPTFPISYILAGIAVVLLALSIWCGTDLLPYWIISGVFVAILAIASHLPLLAGPSHTIYEANSQYYNIRVNDLVRPTDDAPVRFLLMDGSSEAVRFRDSPDPAAAYIDLSLRLIKSLKPSPEQVLSLGGGAYTLPELVKRYSPSTAITVIEIDPEVTEVAKEFFLSDPTENINTITEDARVFLNTNQMHYDVVYTDVYTAGYAIPPSLSSLEAFQLMKRALKPDGILVLNIVSAREGKLSLVYQSLFRTASQAFPHIAVYSTLPDSPTTPQNLILIASIQDAVVEHNLPDFLWKFRCRKLPSDGLLLTDDYAPTDYLVHDLLPTIYENQRTLQ